MAVTYLVMCLFIIFGNLSHILWAVQTIVRSAFNPAAATGGAVGSIFIAMQMGIARSIFATEAGLGSAPIAAAAARTREPARQGLVCMMGTLFTIIICLMTGITIVLAETWRPELGLEGANITIEAFAKGLGFMPNSDYIAKLFIMVSLGFFAFTTILGWDYYAERCLEYLVGKRKSVIMTYRFLYILVVGIGPYLTVSVVWGLADVFNGLMAFPNLIAIIMLSPVVWQTTKEFLAKCREREKWIEYE
jgi:AGCS family alanine or glycine:cation symporter